MEVYCVFQSYVSGPDDMRIDLLISVHRTAEGAGKKLAQAYLDLPEGSHYSFRVEAYPLED